MHMSLSLQKSTLSTKNKITEKWYTRGVQLIMKHFSNLYNSRNTGHSSMKFCFAQIWLFVSQYLRVKIVTISEMLVELLIVFLSLCEISF